VDVVVEPTVKGTPLLATPPTVTTTLPFVAPEGTGATMVEELQLDGVAVTPLKVTVLLPIEPPKFDPEIVTEVPTDPELGARLEMDGAVLPPPPVADLNVATCAVHPVAARVHVAAIELALD
jgi:hypothetical protein